MADLKEKHQVPLPTLLQIKVVVLKTKRTQKAIVQISLVCNAVNQSLAFTNIDPVQLTEDVSCRVCRRKILYYFTGKSFYNILL